MSKKVIPGYEGFLIDEAGNWTINGVSVTEQTLIGRLTGGLLTAVALGIADNNIAQIDGTTNAPVNLDYAKWTASGLEGKSYSEVASDIQSSIDHGSLAAASLLDDDHPGYRQKHGIQTIGAVTFDDDTHILTVATGITYWFNGTQKVISGSTTCDIDTYETLTDNTVYWFYFEDAGGTLKCSDELPDFKTYVYVAVVFWNGTNGAIHREHHSHIRNLKWHEWAHYTIGLRYESGLTLTLPTTDVDNDLQIESGIIWDEDLESVVSLQENCRIVYKASASIYTWVASSLPYAGSGVQPQYLDTDNYTLTNVGASDFVCMWVYATNDIDRPIYIIPTHASTAHNVIALARAEVQPILAALNLSPEMKLIYRFIYKGNGEFQESNDYRLTQALPSGGVATVNAGSVSFIPTGDIAATTVQTAIEELDTEKQPLDSTLTSIALLGTAADKMLYTTNTDVWAEAAITAAGRSMVGAANAAAQLLLMTTAIKAELDLLDLAALTAGELLVATGAAAAAWQSTGVVLTAPKISGSVTTDGLTLPSFTFVGSINAVAGDARIVTTGSAQGLHIESTQDGTIGPQLRLTHISTASAANDEAGRINFYGQDDAQNSQHYAQIRGMIESAANGTEAGKLSFRCAVGAGWNEVWTISSAGLAWFDVGVNADEYYQVAGTQVVATQGAAVADATDADDVILRLNELLARVRTHGLIAT